MSETIPVSRVDQWLKRATELLEASSVPMARLDALILLEEVTDKERGWLLAHPEFTLSVEQIALLDKLIERRANHEPLAYIRGKSEFYGREFIVTPATLQPRPETETMIKLFDELGSVKVVADIGTGSGCLALTAKLEHPSLEIYATEINDEALDVAKLNAKKLDADVRFYQGNLLEPLYNLNVPDVLLCNLPYVPDSHTINQAAMQEPEVAIFGGTDGLDLYRELFTQISKLKYKPEYVLTESLPFQHIELEAIAKSAGYRLRQAEDFIQVFSS